LDPQQFGRERIAPQMGDVGELARLAQQSVHEGQGFFHWQEFVVGKRQRMRQRRRQTLAPIQRTQPAPERRGASMG
jgi:hypothetical protein